MWELSNDCCRRARGICERVAVESYINFKPIVLQNYSFTKIQQNCFSIFVKTFFLYIFPEIYLKNQHEESEVLSERSYHSIQ